MRAASSSKSGKGKVLGRQHYYVSKVEGKSESEVIEALVQRYYLESNDVPPEVVLSSPIESGDAAKEWLTRQRGKPVDVVVAR